MAISQCPALLLISKSICFCDTVLWQKEVSCAAPCIPMPTAGISLLHPLPPFLFSTDRNLLPDTARGAPPLI